MNDLWIWMRCRQSQQVQDYHDQHGLLLVYTRHSFSDRARDRGLHALFVSLCRYLVDGLLPDKGAIKFRKDNPKVLEIKDMILNYVSIVDPTELTAVTAELEDICERWDDQAVGTLSYKWGEKNLLKKDTEEDRFRTMNSMRNVDGQSGVYLLGRL